MDAAQEQLRDDGFYQRLRAEMEMRARLLMAGRTRSKAGQMTQDDLVQEALTKLLSTYDAASLRARPHGQLMALAYRTKKNLVIDHGRKKGAYLQDDDEQHPARELTDRGPSPDERAQLGERAAALQAALEELEEDERRFLSAVIATDSVPEAQRRCGWPPKSPYYVLKQLLSRLRGRLAHLEPRAGGGGS